MKLEELGYKKSFDVFRNEQNLNGFEIGRVISEHKERYVIKTESGKFDAEITGNMRFTARNREDFPAVGDWVACSNYDSGLAIIHSILPRFSIIKRQAVGHFGGIQIIAVNIDYAFIVQSVDRDFNINRMERYLTICNTSKVAPIILLTKTDLVSKQEVENLKAKIGQRINYVPVYAISNQTGDGHEMIKEQLEHGKTYCLLGSSGVGKSTLLNKLAGSEIMATNSISESTNKGRHVSSHRELIVLENGGILIDNPGMREVGIADTADGLETTYEKIHALSEDCRFKDCSHTSESGCAVLHAIDSGEIEKSYYENYMKLEREKAHFDSTLAESRKKDKDFGKMVKRFKKDRNRNKF